ncbi:hypothetical protein EV426DRAFT_700225 [Tirmania nivea]|nr:hypothetical protein EV426DRAFT_700225 [Tirmania nivea]
MPKKHRQRLYTKPPSTAPATLASSSIRPTPSAQPPTQSVNGLLHHLRVSQAKSSLGEQGHIALPGSAPIGQPRTHHPSVAALLGADPTPIPFRPRSRVIGSRALPRTTAGPPPPRSWVSVASSVATSRPLIAGGKCPSGDNEERDRDAIRLPGMIKVSERSLMHYALLTLTKNWDWVVIYEQYYLCTLRPGLKALLGAYAGAYSGGMGLGEEGLRVLYPPRKTRESELGDGAELIGKEANNPAAEKSSKYGLLQDTWEAPDDDSDSDFSNLEGTTHLDLTHSLGRTAPDMQLSLKNLERFLFSGQLLPPPPDSMPPVIPDQLPRSIQSPPRLHLPSLSHLSLAYPSNLHPTSLWSPTAPHNLPYILSFIPTLTHLSLAGWPGPPASLSSPAVARVVRGLAHSTYCLKWLDLSSWTMGVLEIVFMGAVWEVEMDAVWGGWWRGVETVVWLDGGGGGRGREEESMTKGWEKEVGRVRRTIKSGGRRLRVVLGREEEG